MRRFKNVLKFIILLDSTVFGYYTAEFYINVLCHQTNVSTNPT